MKLLKKFILIVPIFFSLMIYKVFQEGSDLQPEATSQSADEKESKDSIQVRNRQKKSGQEDAIKSQVQVNLEAIARVTEETSAQDLYRLFSELKNLIQSQPENAALVFERIRQTKDRSPAVKRQLTALFGSLAQSYDSSIASELTTLANECADEFCKIQAIVAASDHPAPSQASLEQMFSIYLAEPDTEHGATAILASGSMAKRVVNGKESWSENLLRLWSPALGPETKINILAAMGNHGHAEYLPILASAIADRDPRIRAVATYSLRYLPQKEADLLLLKLLEEGQDPMVMEELYKALEYRTLNEVQYLFLAQKSLNLASSQQVKAAGRVLLRATSYAPKQVETALKLFKDQVKDPAVRNYIDAELAQP